MKKILVLGATSAIAQATARRMLVEGAAFYLVARDANKLKSVEDDIHARGGSVLGTYVADLDEYEKHAGLIQEADRTLNGIDTVFLAHGVLGDQKQAEESFENTLEILRTNLISPVSLLTHVANLLEKKGHGLIVVISSVAGDRAKRSNYVYGMTKGALTLFSAGLRSRLHKAGVRVLTIKPGFVDSPMTSHFRKGLLWSSPERIARGVMSAIRRGKEVVYLPGYWRAILWIIRILPERYFKRLTI